MKTLILILTLFFSHLLADEKPIISHIYTYASADKNLTLDDIRSKDSSFLETNKDQRWMKIEDEKRDPNSTLWVKIVLKSNLTSGRYIVNYGFNEFDILSFSPSQDMYKFSLYGTNNLSFRYEKDRDSLVYYARVIKSDMPYSMILNGTSSENFYSSLNDSLIYMLITGVVLGLILMTAIYNGAIYYFNRQLSFLYYALMQVFMVGVLLYHTGVPQTSSVYLLKNPIIYEYFSLITSLFAILFAKSFLETKKQLPNHDKVLTLFLIVICLDMLYYPKDIISTYGLYSLTTAYFLVVGYARFRQGYKPALYFLLGWVALTLGVLFVEHFDDYIYFDTMLIGSSIEAIMLAIALAFKIRQMREQKQEQQEIMIHQSKLASMGDMIGNIAHQWRQPLTHLSYIFMNLEELDDKNLRSKKIAEGTKQLEFMSETIDDFRDFYAPCKEKEVFSLEDEIGDVIDLMHFDDIKIDLKIISTKNVKIYKNQYKQVLLNLLSNAKEALLENGIKKPIINIVIDGTKVDIYDNGGGLSLEDINKIFEPYFTTKEGSSGIGLYMSKMIVQKNLNGKLSVKNTKDGACFTLAL